MRLIYTDPGLYSNLGHHANSCRAIRDAFFARNIGVETLGNRLIEPQLRAELNAHAHFRCYTYWSTDGDPISGWLNAFQTTVKATDEDLGAINGINPDDVLYLNSARPGQFLALANWAMRMGDQRPPVVVEFGDDPGIALNEDGQGFAAPRDNKAVLWRYAATQLPREGIPRFHMTTFDDKISKLYTALLQQPVGILPLPQGKTANPVNRVGKRPITVGVLGHQRGEKGYHLVPLTVAILLHVLPDVQFLIHNAAPDYMEHTQQQIRGLARDNPRVIVDERVADPTIWQELLDKTDLMLCPYDPERYAIAYSAVAVEALANGVPLVVPNNTTLSQTMNEYGEAGTAFDEYQSQAIAMAVAKALDDYDTLAERAFRASTQYAQANGAGNTAEEILKLAGA